MFEAMDEVSQYDTSRKTDHPQQPIGTDIPIHPLQLVRADIPEQPEHTVQRKARSNILDVQDLVVEPEAAGNYEGHSASYRAMQLVMIMMDKSVLPLCD